jgi:HEAT repeat protein
MKFRDAITANSVDVRIAAVRWAALFKSNAPRATPELIKCFNDPDLAVRKEATNALEKIAPALAPSASH